MSALLAAELSHRWLSPRRDSLHNAPGALSQLQLPVLQRGQRAVRGPVESVDLRHKFLGGDDEFPPAVHALVVQHQGVGFVAHIGLDAVKLSVKSAQGIPGNEKQGVGFKRRIRFPRWTGNTQLPAFWQQK